MGCGEDVYKSAVRLSISSDNDSAEITEAVRRISAVVLRLREQTPS